MEYQYSIMMELMVGEGTSFHFLALVCPTKVGAVVSLH